MASLDQNELTQECMEMIAYAGEGRALTYEALELCLKEEWNAALDKIVKAEKHLSDAHQIQFEKLMARQARGDEIPCNMLLLHAMDLLMVSTAEKDMLKAIVNAHCK